MRIKYVVSTMVFWWREHHLSFEQECDFLKSMGFGVELWPNIRGHGECRYEKRNWPRLKSATESMLVSMHSRNDGPTLAEWVEQLDCAKNLNANIVADLQSLCISEELGLADWDFCGHVIKAAEKANVKICIESGSLKVLKEVGKKFDSIWYCLDTGVAHIDPKFSFNQYVDELAPRIAHLHLSDNYGKIDEHEPPGLDGGIPRDDWRYLLDALNKYDNEVVGSLEMFPCLPHIMIRQASEFLFDKLNWPDRPKKSSEADDTNYRPE